VPGYREGIPGEGIGDFRLSEMRGSSWLHHGHHSRADIRGRSQIEIDVPVTHQAIDGQWQNGVGDVSLGVKREMFYSLRTGSILSLFGGVVLPTGDRPARIRRGYDAV